MLLSHFSLPSVWLHHIHSLWWKHATVPNPGKLPTHILTWFGFSCQVCESLVLDRLPYVFLLWWRDFVFFIENFMCGCSRYPFPSLTPHIYGSPHAEAWHWSHFHHTAQNQSQMHQRPHSKLLEGDTGGTLDRCSRVLSENNFVCLGSKAMHWQMGPHRTKNPRQHRKEPVKGRGSPRAENLWQLFT